MLIGCLELQINLLLCLEILSASDVEVDGEGLVAVDTTQIPLVGRTNTNFRRGNKLIAGNLDWGTLTDGSANFKVC